MLVIDYLSKKYPDGRWALSKIEAKFFNEKYPLKKDWFFRIKDIEFTPEMQDELSKRLTGNKRRSSKNRALKALGRQEFHKLG